MAASGLREDASSYYPPRSRWYTRLFSDSWRPMRRHAQIERLYLPGRLPPFRVLMSLVVPGLSLLLLGRRMLGWVFIAVYLVAAVAFVMRLGYRTGEIGYGALISVHATSVFFLVAHWLQESLFRTRVLVAICTLIAVWGLFYMPVMLYAEAHWITPMRVGNNVMIVQRGVSAQSFKRGDWVAYKIAGNRFGDHEDQVVLEGGLALDRVIALPGDHVQFSNNVVFVNGEAFSATARMPVAGEFEVPQKVWFIWPNVDIYRHGAAGANITATLQDAAMVTEKQMIGRAFKSWCGRRQLP